MPTRSQEQRAASRLALSFGAGGASLESVRARAREQLESDSVGNASRLRRTMDSLATTYMATVSPMARLNGFTDHKRFVTVYDCK